MRSGWYAVNESGVMDLWRSGARRASAAATASEDLRNALACRWKTLRTRPVKRLQFGERGGFARHPRLPNLRILALSSEEFAVAAIYTDASSIHGWGASFGGHYIQGKWSEVERRESINWKESWALRRALETWGTMFGR